MTVYTEMLKLALAEGPDDGPPALADLIERVLEARSGLSAGGDPADRLARVLAYDVALIRLCEWFRVDHGLTGDSAGPGARAEAEEKLAEWVPGLARLSDDGGRRAQ